MSLLFLTVLMSHWHCKEEEKNRRRKKMAVWSVLIALAEPVVRLFAKVWHEITGKSQRM